MINYSEKGYGLHQMLAAQGIELRNVDGVWIANASDENVSQLIADYNPWPYEKAQKIIDLNLQFEQAVEALTADTIKAEQVSWAIQEKEAKEYPDKTPVYLSILAEARGVSLEVLVEKVLLKSHKYSQAYFALQGLRDKLKDQIKTFPDEGSLERLDELKALSF